MSRAEQITAHQIAATRSRLAVPARLRNAPQFEETEILPSNVHRLPGAAADVVLQGLGPGRNPKCVPSIWRARRARERAQDATARVTELRQAVEDMSWVLDRTRAELALAIQELENGGEA